MADDDFDPWDASTYNPSAAPTTLPPDQLPQNNPPGTARAIGNLSPNDPLIDWGSNLKPSDMQQYVHDPEGFKQNMINQGITPPDHHYVQDPSGNLQAVNPSTGQPVYRGMSQPNDFGFMGEGRGDAPPAPQQTAPPPMITGPQGPQGRALKYMPNPEGPTPWDETLERQMEGRPTGSNPPKPPPVPPKEEGRLPGMTGPTTGPGVEREPPGPTKVAPGQVPLPAPSPLKPTPSTTEGGIDRTGDALNGPEKEKKGGKTPEQEQADKAKELADKKKKVDDSLDDFAKSMQGVKAPPRPQLPGVGTPGVRSPVSVQPQIQNLLGLVGAARPQMAQQSLMRLLGRA